MKITSLLAMFISGLSLLFTLENTLENYCSLFILLLLHTWHSDMIFCEIWLQEVYAMHQIHLNSTWLVFLNSRLVNDGGKRNSLKSPSEKVPQAQPRPQPQPEPEFQPAKQPQQKQSEPQPRVAEKSWCLWFSCWPRCCWYMFFGPLYVDKKD